MCYLIIYIHIYTCNVILIFYLVNFSNILSWYCILFIFLEFMMLFWMCNMHSHNCVCLFNYSFIAIYCQKVLFYMILNDLFTVFICLFSNVLSCICMLFYFSYFVLTYFVFYLKWVLILNTVFIYLFIYLSIYLSIYLFQKSIKLYSYFE